MPTKRGHQFTTHPALPTGMASLAHSFRRHLLARGRSERTVQSYLEAIRSLTEYLTARNMPTEVEAITREHIEEYIIHERTRAHSVTGLPVKPSLAANRYRSLQSFFRWCLDEGELERNPMDRMKPPQVPKDPPAVLTEDELLRLVDTCKGRDFYSKRDAAILWLLIDTGMRNQELAGIQVPDVNLEHDTVTVTGKGQKKRTIPLGHQAADALDRYMRARTRRPLSHTSHLWLGYNGPMTGSGIRYVLEEHGKAAGVPNVYTHRFRHTFAHMFLSNGGQRDDLMLICGWDTDEMPRWYGKSVAAERARKAHRRFSPADRLREKWGR